MRVEHVRVSAQADPQHAFRTSSAAPSNITLPSTVKRELRIVIIMSSLRKGSSEWPRVQNSAAAQKGGGGWRCDPNNAAIAADPRQRR